MGSKCNLITPRNGEIIIAATQDFLTGAYLITHKDSFFDRSAAATLLASVLAYRDAHLRLALPTPALLRPVRLWTGKQLFALILRPNGRVPVALNLRAKGKAYSGRGEDMCANDAFIVVHNSEIMCGVLDKGV